MIERLRDVQCVLLAKVEESIYYETTIQAMKDKTTPITVVTK